MVVTSRSLPDVYQDSVKLMRAASDVVEGYEVEEALAVMATDENKAMVIDAGLLDETELRSFGPNDLLLVVEAEDEAIATEAVDALEDGVRGARPTGRASDTAGAPAPRSLTSAIGELPDANLALVSVPGDYAAREAWKGLHAGLHVHVFSDNVSIAEECALKEHASEAGRLVMGPDCGTAILNGVPLGFANAVDRGPIGVVAASGTGLQEVTSLVDRAGSGVSQAIGTGGRDLSAEVGGLTMRQGLERLDDDPDTEVIVLVSKPPAPETAETLLDTVEGVETPVVVQFIGADASAIESAGAVPAETLDDAARRAVEAVDPDGTVSFDDGVEGFSRPSDAEAIADELGSPSSGRTDVRGLFSGGTFAVEAATLLGDQLGELGSNVAAGTALDDPLSPSGHAVVDLGADTFTRGRPHPMIDPGLRTEQLRAALADDDVLLVLLDVVLGHGAHEDPAAPVVEAVGEARAGDWPAVVASVCGTRADPQGWSELVGTLQAAGIYVTESNADAARLAGELWTAATDGGDGT